MGLPKLVRHVVQDAAVIEIVAFHGIHCDSSSTSFPHTLCIAIVSLVILSFDVSCHFSGTWGLPKVDTKEVKPVKRISKKPDESKPEKHCGPWGVVSVHEVEDIMGLE
jgi:hypothetical protein